MKKVLLFFICLFIAGSAFAQKEYKGDGPDDYLRLIPLGATVALKACGVQSRDDWQHLLLNAGVSTLITAATTYTLKNTIHDTRPDGTDRHAFPSGHASIAFSGAHVLFKEYKDVSPWIGIGGYAVATAVSCDRVRRNRHHWDDVVAGAAIGILSTEFSYWLGNKLWPSNKENLQVSLTPSSLHLSFPLFSGAEKRGKRDIHLPPSPPYMEGLN